jgi:hypothetical protein
MLLAPEQSGFFFGLGGVALHAVTFLIDLGIGALSKSALVF